MVYGQPLKHIIHEKFGDGIMSAINFSCDVQKKTTEAGERVVITFNGKVGLQEFRAVVLSCSGVCVSLILSHSGCLTPGHLKGTGSLSCVSRVPYTLASGLSDPPERLSYRFGTESSK